MKTNKTKTVKTIWEIWEYDLNGYTVNTRLCVDREKELILRVKTANQGSEREFDYAEVSDYMLKQIFGVSCKISVNGDDVNYYVSRKSDDYPIGELICVSHDTLSPITSKYIYHVDMDERGIFAAHVENEREEIVFSMRYEDGDGDGDGDGYTIFDMGYMKHKNDIEGLHDYMLMLGILPKNSSLKMG
jgi:hypothetical protein